MNSIPVNQYLGREKATQNERLKGEHVGLSHGGYLGGRLESTPQGIEVRSVASTRERELTNYLHYT